MTLTGTCLECNYGWRGPSAHTKASEHMAAHKHNVFFDEDPSLDEPDWEGKLGVPQCCPICRSTNFTTCVEWFAHSLEPQDLHNTAKITEYQCAACAISFWM